MNKKGQMAVCDQGRYIRYWQEKEQEWNARCGRCGSCCGALEDPCVNLQKLQSGGYACRLYENRLGRQRTVSGKEFMCVPVREKISAGQSWPGDERCEYKNAVT
ncbi:MAG TPA: hypothetical protein PLJ26_03390 [Candidatus Omnitrophota bacterium]|nr:hypothetical protein [Candidatus Omnitrophota bacterium]